MCLYQCVLSFILCVYFGQKTIYTALLSSQPGFGLDDPGGHHMEVLALVSDGQALVLDRGQDLSKT